MTDQTASSKILVTGAAGFIGSTLCESLVHTGLQVTGLDNFHDFYDPTTKERNLKSLINKTNFKLIRGDICNPTDLIEAFRDRPDTVIHLAAMAGVRPSMQQPVAYQHNNVGGTLSILETCRQYSVQHVIFGSSSSVYGNSRRIPFCEDDPAICPLSVYAATKRSGELLCHTYHHAYGMNITMLRFFTVYGPRQRPDLAIHKFARLIIAGKSIPFFGDGSMQRDYTFIHDIVDGVRRAMHNPSGLRLFNLGSDNPIRLDELVDTIGRVLGKKVLLEKLPPPIGDVQRTWADLTKSRQELGYCPSTGLETGLEIFTSWLRQETE